MPHRVALLAVGLVAVGGCSPLTGITCTTESVPALLVDVRDSVTNAPAGEGARIIARSGTYADTAQAVASYTGPYGVAHEREGTYTLTVEREGYATWTRGGIAVTKGVCHVRTVEITARLQR